jgi:hypothetical protein
VSPKDSFWTGLQGGLLDKKHYLKMGMAIWLFGYLTRSQTGLNEAGEGVVNYGHPLTFDKISDDLKGISVRSIRLWAARLRRESYIRTETHSNNGMTFWIAKAKSKTKVPRVVYEKSAQNSRHNSVTSSKNSRHDTVTSEGDSRYPSVTSQNKIPPQIVPHAALTSFFNSSTPKDSTSENPSYYNNTAAAKAAADLLSPLIRAKSLPRAKSQRELDARRREILLQAEEVKQKYPTNRSRPGKASIA